MKWSNEFRVCAVRNAYLLLKDISPFNFNLDMMDMVMDMVKMTVDMMMMTPPMLMKLPMALTIIIIRMMIKMTITKITKTMMFKIRP